MRLSLKPWHDRSYRVAFPLDCLLEFLCRDRSWGPRTFLISLDHSRAPRLEERFLGDSIATSDGGAFESEHWLSPSPTGQMYTSGPTVVPNQPSPPPESHSCVFPRHDLRRGGFSIAFSASLCIRFGRLV
ncbi:hypothetical protein CFRS1_v007783 [Colletotrichum fructicola]|nr:hypothetical protein CFRS1_v007783 [Colletotrichum fructicola]